MSEASARSSGAALGNRARRHALLVMAGGLWPAGAMGQTAAPAAPAAPPHPVDLPLNPASPASPPNRPTGPIDASKLYYVFFDQAIDATTMRAMRRQLAELVEAGVMEITLVIDSPGGATEEMLITYSFIRSLPVRVNTHAQGFVASAANGLFLAGENRSADRNANFFFHPARSGVAEYLSEQQMRDRQAVAATFAESVARLYRDRTRLTEPQIASFQQSEVFFSAEQAKQAGIVQTVADLRMPGNHLARIVFLN